MKILVVLFFLIITFIKSDPYQNCYSSVTTLESSVLEDCPLDETCFLACKGLLNIDGVRFNAWISKPITTALRKDICGPRAVACNCLSKVIYFSKKS
jgi:hypothetical protein